MREDRSDENDHNDSHSSREHRGNSFCESHPPSRVIYAFLSLLALNLDGHHADFNVRYLPNRQPQDKTISKVKVG